MNEKQFGIDLPEGIWIEGGRLKVTQDGAQSLRVACEAIEVQAKKRQWRDGDLVKHSNTDHFTMRMKNRWHGTAGEGEDSGADRDIEMGKAVYVGNLRDLLTQGKILLAVNENELIHLIGGYSHAPLLAKLQSYLADYRERTRNP